jgi:phosphoribosylformimino-5-aminoimidazole carboxamide ribotide isomerase
MELYPAIDLLDGKCVRLLKGDFEKATLYSDNPLEILARLEAEGAQFLHCVDLSGAKNPENRQLPLLRRLLAQTQIQIQCGGGIRSAHEVHELFEVGVSRVVLGSIAHKDPELTRTLLREYGPERITLAMDVEIQDNGQLQLATEGWKTKSKYSVSHWLGDYLEAGLKRVLCTDIGRDGMMIGPNLSLYETLLHGFPQLEFQASGGVSQLADLLSLKALGLHSCIFGKALYEGKIDLKEALLQC